MDRSFLGIFSFLFLVGLSSGQNPPSTLSIHILDNETGYNAANVTCKLYKWDDNSDFVHLATEVTDHDGRIHAFIPVEDYVPGVYQTWCDTKSYFNSHGKSTMWPAVQVTWRTVDVSTDYHIPIVLSAWGFGTYHGN